MSLATNIVRRGSRYYVRVTAPMELRSKIGKKEIWKSLNTADPKEAKQLAPAAILHIRNRFNQLGFRGVSKEADIVGGSTPFKFRITPSENDVANAVYRFYQRECELHYREFRDLPTAADICAAENKLWAEGEENEEANRAKLRSLQNADESRETYLKMIEDSMRQLASRGDTTPVHWAADEILQRECWDMDKDSPKYRDLCHRLMRANLEAYKRVNEWEKGVFDGKPTDPVVQPPSDKAITSRAKPGEWIMELYDRFAAENPKNVRADTQITVVIRSRIDHPHQSPSKREGPIRPALQKGYSRIGPSLRRKLYHKVRYRPWGQVISAEQLFWEGDMGKQILFCFLFAILLTGCAIPAKTLTATQGSIVLKYNRNFETDDNAISIAQRHCAQYGKMASLTNTVISPSGNWYTVTFQCVDN